MQVHQIEIFAIVLAMLALFIWERLRYDIVASLSLLAALATGCLGPEKAFSGFSNPVIIVIAAILVLSRGVQASGVFDTSLRRLLKSTRSVDAQVAAMTSGVTLLSAGMKNVGALGIFLPIALQTASRMGRRPSIYLMPLSFGSLIGGAVTLIGTSPNLLISSVRVQLGGRPFSMFAFAPVALPLACTAVVFLTFGWRLLPHDRKPPRSAEQSFDVEPYTTELRVRPQSPLIGRSVRELEEYSEGELDVILVARGSDAKPRVAAADWRFHTDDLVTVRADPTFAKKIADARGLEFADAKALAPTDVSVDELEAVEAIVLPNSPIIGKTSRQLRLRRTKQASLLAVSRAGRPVTARLRDHAFASGDVLVIQGWRKDLFETLAELGCLPLADRGLNLARRGGRWIPVLILAASLILVLTNRVPVEIAFFAGAVAMVLFKQVTAKEAYDSIDWPIVVMLATLLPIGDAMRDTGAADLLAHGLGAMLRHAPTFVALGSILTAAMLLAPLMHHAAAVLVMGPVAAAVAHQLGLQSDPFLIAVALGASCDFLTPIGHQNNMLVMGPGGYRFGDYWRLGLPLSLLVVFAGTPLILWFWPLR